jgi:hypothetical protein
MTRKVFLAIPAAMLLGAGLYFYGGHVTPQAQPALANLTPENLSTIESAFNESSSDVRVLVMLSPT